MTTRDEFGAFVEAVLADYLGLGRAEWENTTVERLLDALSAFATARVVTVIDDQEAPSWRLFAEMLHAATGYEERRSRHFRGLTAPSISDPRCARLSDRNCSLAVVVICALA